MIMKNILKANKAWITVLIPLFAVLLFTGCEDEDPTPVPTPTNDPIASFQFEIDANDFLTVNFTNNSQNATTYSWDYGDGNTSTQEAASHTYAEGGTYTVTLTASDGSASADFTQNITITDPDQQLALLAGATSKTWYLQREGIALGVGPAANDNQWWSFGGVTPLGDRPCILDDEITFFRNGNVLANTGGTVFCDAAANGGWKGDEGCLDESDPDAFTHFETGEDVSDFANGGDYTFDYSSSTEVLTVSGSGFYVGLPVKTNDGDNYVPVNLKTYNVINLVEGTTADSLTLALQGTDFSWNFYLVSYDNISDLPAIPTAQPLADFSVSKDGLTVTFLNMSANADTYEWDFGDGNSSTEAEPTHTYAEFGDYDVTLTITDVNGVTDSVTKQISLSDAVFSAAALSNMDGKTWRLAGEGSYKVGPVPNSGEWWGGIDAVGVEERACQLDDEFTFSDDGAFVIETQGVVWTEDYMGVPIGCTPVGDLVAPFDALGGGSFTFTATDTQVTVTGPGAYIGFNKPYNGAELVSTDTALPTSITYDVVGYTSSAAGDELILAIDYTPDNSGYWTITMRSEN